MGPGVTSGLCMNGMNKPLATVDAVRSERVKLFLFTPSTEDFPEYHHTKGMYLQLK